MNLATSCLVQWLISQHLYLFLEIPAFVTQNGLLGFFSLNNLLKHNIHWFFKSKDIQLLKGQQKIQQMLFKKTIRKLDYSEKLFRRKKWEKKSCWIVKLVWQLIAEFPENNHSSQKEEDTEVVQWLFMFNRRWSTTYEFWAF